VALLKAVLMSEPNDMLPVPSEWKNNVKFGRNSHFVKKEDQSLTSHELN
jgi:hypothetical protein